MQINGTSFEVSRRHFLQTAAAIATGLGKLGPAQARPSIAGTVRDRLWVFCCPINSDYPNVHQRSVMSPVESAFYLGVPNIMIVQDHPRPGQEAVFKPFEQPFEQYTYAMRPLKRVLWSVVGGGGVTDAQERQQVLALAKRTPNVVGVYMDDFFTGKTEGKQASLTVEELRDLRQQLQSSDKKLDIYVTFYTRYLKLPLTDYMNLIDVMTLWTSYPDDLVNLESYLPAAEKLAPHSSKVLGCYVVDFARKKSIPVSAMQLQCETGLRWLRQGRIEGIIFLGNTVMDLGYEAVDWTRDWIARVGDLHL
jgi:hypothetical protein